MRFRRSIFTITKPQNYIILLLDSILFLYFLAEKFFFRNYIYFGVNSNRKTLEVHRLVDWRSIKERKIIYFFNPNYLTEYRGYVLGIDKNIIDRLFAYSK
jgi:hypothetical protein